MSDCTLHGLVDHSIVIVCMRLVVVNALSLGDGAYTLVRVRICIVKIYYDRSRSRRGCRNSRGGQLGLCRGIMIEHTDDLNYTLFYS